MDIDDIVRTAQKKIWADLQVVVDEFVQGLLDELRGDLLYDLEESWRPSPPPRPPAVRATRPRRRRPRRATPASDPDDEPATVAPQPEPAPEPQFELPPMEVECPTSAIDAEPLSVAEPEPPPTAPAATPPSTSTPTTDAQSTDTPTPIAPSPKKVRKPPRRTEPRARTIPTKRAVPDEIVDSNDDFVMPRRPLDRSDCEHGINDERPCPWVGCKYHLYLDVNPTTGAIKLNFPHLEPWDLKDCCALDVAERGGITLEETGKLTNLTRERIRQVEVRGLLKLKASSPSEDELGKIQEEPDVRPKRRRRRRPRPSHDQPPAEEGG